jgi:enterochelin esterase-like enzyme
VEDLVQLLALLVLIAAPAPHVDLPPPVVIRSPEVQPDHRVTLRLLAPKASAVTVAGEWTHPAPNTPQAMTKDAQGIWSITIGPVEPNIYIYLFTVDGVTMTDPVNPLIKLRARGSASMVEVPGGQPWEPRPVPHGTLETITHDSAVLEQPRQFVVYLPPGYEKSRQRYPVTYLLHGTNDMQVGWTMAGRANVVLDNFLADKKVVPMIVVMPWGHALPFGHKDVPGQPTNNDTFERYLIGDVAPLVEARYRIAPGRHNHAVVGLSMGGAQALQIGLRHRDRFGTIGVFGSGMKRDDFEEKYGKLLAGPAYDLVYIGIAKDDPGHERAKELAETLGAHGVHATYEEIEGGHTYPTWRNLWVRTAPLLFRK